ncbi:MAG: FMN-binding protein [Clostridia bacterium]|nr:FMN-binding protein [Clostridia bacterium]
MNTIHLQRGEDKMLKIMFWIVTGLVAVIGGAVIRDMVGRRGIKSLLISAVDFSGLRDGVYTGQYKGGRWSNKVKVTVASGRVTAIDVVRDIQYQSEVTRKAINEVIEAQSLQVDTVSGATITTKAFLKAVENALVETKQRR